jgi:hypothetical protein
MNFRVTVGNKEIMEKYGQNAAQAKAMSTVEGYRVSFFMELDGGMKREYVTFNVKKEFFDSVQMNQTFDLTEVVKAVVPVALPKDEKPVTNLFDTKPDA